LSEPLILDGTATAATIRAEVAARVQRLKAEKGVTPGLAAVLAGDNPASVTYVKMKRRACEKAGIVSTAAHVRPPTPPKQQIPRLGAMELNADPSVHGILVQHPLPKGHDAVTPCSPPSAPDKTWTHRPRAAWRPGEERPPLSSRLYARRYGRASGPLTPSPIEGQHAVRDRALA
jgi:hypothetical protein